MSKIYGNRKTHEVKDCIIKARVTKHEKGLIEIHAKLKGMSVSEYVLNLIIKDMNGNDQNKR